MHSEEWERDDILHVAEEERDSVDDPLRAMLQELVPSLQGDPSQAGGGAKKKVSYKEAAAQLLGDQ